MPATTISVVSDDGQLELILMPRQPTWGGPNDWSIALTGQRGDEFIDSHLTTTPGMPKELHQWVGDLIRKKLDTVEPFINWLSANAVVGGGKQS